MYTCIHHIWETVYVTVLLNKYHDQCILAHLYHLCTTREHSEIRTYDTQMLCTYINHNYKIANGHYATFSLHNVIIEAAKLKTVVTKAETICRAGVLEAM